MIQIQNNSLLFTIHFFQGGLKSAWGRLTAKHAPLIRANMRIWLKIRVFLGWSKFVSAYVERDKKILEFWIFAGNYMRKLLRSLDTSAALSAGSARDFRFASGCVFDWKFDADALGTSFADNGFFLRRFLYSETGVDSDGEVLYYVHSPFD